MNEEKKKKSPILALILSGILPGIGQIYNGETNKGLVLLGLNFVISYLLSEPLRQFMEAGGSSPANPFETTVYLYLIAGLFLWIYAMVDAKRTAERINREQTDVMNDDYKY